MPIIEALTVSKSFKGQKVLSGLNLSVEQNEIFGFLGPNGAGKSTTLKLLIGYIKKDSGQIKFFGKDFDSNRKEILKRIGVVPQEEKFYLDFSVRENIDFFGSMYGLPGQFLKESTSGLIDWLNLKSVEKVKAKFLSGGYRRLLNIACSLVHNPEIIFLDEPTVGLDPNMRRMFWQKIRDLKQMGKTVCLTTHYMDEAERLCDRIALVTKGNVIVDGRPEELIKKYGGQMVLKLNFLRHGGDEAIMSDISKTFPTVVFQEKENQMQLIIKSDFEAREFSRISIILTRLSDHATFFDLHEPTLEDVFFNLTGEKQEVNKLEPPKVYSQRN